MDIMSLGKWLIALGLLVAGAGALLVLASRIGLPLGSLPGDVNVTGRRFSVHVPLATCIVLSLLLTLVLNLIARFMRR